MAKHQIPKEWWMRAGKPVIPPGREARKTMPGWVTCHVHATRLREDAARRRGKTMQKGWVEDDGRKALYLCCTPVSG